MMNNKPFALKIQTVLIVLLLVCFVLMGQPVSQLSFQFGTVLLIITAILQIDFGNINPDSDFKRSMSAFFKILAIIIVVFACGILLAPYFLNKLFVKNFVLMIIFGGTGLYTLLICFGSHDKKDGE